MWTVAEADNVPEQKAVGVVVSESPPPMTVVSNGATGLLEVCKGTDELFDDKLVCGSESAELVCTFVDGTVRCGCVEDNTLVFEDEKCSHCCEDETEHVAMGGVTWQASPFFVAVVVLEIGAGALEEADEHATGVGVAAVGALWC